MLTRQDSHTSDVALHAIIPVSPPGGYGRENTLCCVLETWGIVCVQLSVRFVVTSKCHHAYSQELSLTFTNIGITLLGYAHQAIAVRRVTQGSFVGLLRT